MKKAEFDEREMTALYLSGLTMQEVGHRCGVTRVTIRNRLVSLGVPLRDTSAKRRVDQHGYEVFFQPSHPLSRSNGYVAVHRLVMCRVLGRILLPSETIHHIDGDRLNNEPSNLQLRDGNHGKDGCYECVDCGSRNIRPIPLD